MSLWQRGFMLTLAAALVLGPRPIRSEPVIAVDREQVNIREDATTQSRRLTVLRRGEQAEELRRHGRWIQIRMLEGDIGWVHADLIQERFIVVGNGVRVRSGPSTADGAVTMLYDGQELGKLALQGSWMSVSLSDGRTGWVHQRFTRRKTGDDVRAALPSMVVEAELPDAAEEAPAEVDEQQADEAGVPVAPDGTDAVEVTLERELLRDPYADGLQQEAAGDFGAALERFEEVLAGDPDHLNALFHAAQAHTRMRQYDEALVKLYRALDRSGGRKDIYLTLGEVYRAQAQLDSARKYQTLFTGGDVVVDMDIPLEPVIVNPEPDDAGLPDELPWLLLAIAGSGFAVVVALVAWVRLRDSGKAEVAANETRKPDKFARALEHQADEARQGKATEGEEEALDRQIDDKWRELRQSAQLFKAGGEGQGDDEEGNLDRILDNVETLRKALDMQDDRARIYAEIVRLQNMKIEAMGEEIRLLRRKPKGR